jgi:hypothetical protein
VIAIQEAINSGARKYKACDYVGLNMRTYRRWFDAEKKVREDARKLRKFTPPNNTRQQKKI